jgi:hypothetical protein
MNYFSGKELKYILLTIILILLFIILYFHFLYKKTIYLVWRNKIENGGTIHGFGDKLRGAIYLYQYCNENNINLIIDGTDDICGDYLKNVKSIYYPIIKDKPLINFGDKDIEEIKETIHKELLTNNVIYIYSNYAPINDLSEKDKEFAKKICQPSNSLTLEINEKLKKLPLDFGIKHFRFNDKVFNNDVDSSDKLFNKYFDLLKSDLKPTDVLFTNSNNFKKYAKEKLGIITIDCNNEICNIQHIGESTEKEPIKNSFIEFFIISKSSYIKTHTCYEWPSNFVKWSSIIYNIPFDNVFVDENLI